MMDPHLPGRLYHGRHQRLPIPAATTLGANHHGFDVRDGKLQGMFDAKRRRRHDIPLVPDDEYVSVGIR